MKLQVEIFTSCYPSIFTIHFCAIDIPVKNDMYGMDFSHFCESSFQDDISIQSWNTTSYDSNYVMNDFLWRLDGCVKRHAPTKKLNKKEVKRKLNPWMTNQIMKLIKIRDYLREKTESQIILWLNLHIKELEIRSAEKLKSRKISFIQNILNHTAITSRRPGKEFVR